MQTQQIRYRHVDLRSGIATLDYGLAKPLTTGKGKKVLFLHQAAKVWKLLKKLIVDK
jgi:hypothetical protein